MLKDDVRSGSVVAWWSGGDLAFGVVAGEEKQRVRLITPKGKEERAKPARIAAEVVPPGEIPGTSQEDRQRAGERAASVAARVAEQASAVDVALLWDIVNDGLDADDAAPAADLAQLAELALGSSHGDARTALMIALRRDGMHFVRKGDDWEPRSASTLDDLRHQKEAEARRREEEQRFFSALADAMRGRPFESTGSKLERRAIDALEQLAIFEDQAPEPARAHAQSVLQVLSREGLKHDRPHEGAFRALRAMGHFEDEDVNLQLQRYRLEPAFDPRLEAHADALVQAFDAAGRSDRRDAAAVSIDSPTTREIDDLLCVAPRDDGGFRVTIHIADPTAFLPLGDPLDDEAMQRGLTRYMPDVRVLMLPVRISEHAASLAVGEDRPAVTYDVELAPDGSILDFAIEPSMVRSAARLSYDEADAGMGEGAVGPHAELLKELARFGSVRQAARLREGAVVIDAPEVEVKVDASGTPYLERGERDSPARRAVTEAMVLVGSVAARYCREHGIPAIYRRQAAPPAGVPTEVVRDPAQVRAVRRSLRRAETGLKPGVHASLGLDAYVQVTSPLRRYQDLTTLRQILAHRAGRPLPHDVESLRAVAATTDRAEIEARRAERTVNEYWLLRYLEGRTGEVLEGRIVETQPRAVVLLDEIQRDQPMPSLSGEPLGATVDVVVERVVPRAGLVVLRKR